MASVSITYDGPPAQRLVVKVTAMAPLSSLLAEACAKMKPPLDPARSSLTFNKKPLIDLSCPFRLANIPNGSSLTLLYDKPRASTAAPAASQPPTAPPVRAGGSPAPAAAALPLPIAATRPAPPPTAAIAAPIAAPAQAVADSAPGAATCAAIGAQPPLPLPQQQLSADALKVSPAATAAAASPAPVANAAPAGPEAPPANFTAAPAVAVSELPEPSYPPGPMEVDDAATGSGAADDATTTTAGSLTDADAAATAAGATIATAFVNDANSGLDEDDSESTDHLGLGRPSALFTRQALEEALEAVAAASRSVGGGGGARGRGGGRGLASGVGGPGAGDDDAAEYDEFYDMTAEELAAMLRSSQARRVQEEAAGFRTRAAREAEEQAKASSYSHVAIRAHLPGGCILQVVFAATETVGALRSAVLAVLAPSLAPAAYLYTTPPRQVLRPDQDHHSLYHAGLVPAAHVHVGLDDKKAATAEHSPGTGTGALRPEAAAQLRTHIAPGLAAFHGGSRTPQAHVDERKRPGQGQGPQGAPGMRAASASGAAGGSGGGGGGGGGAKVPKWLKLVGK